ncbi:MAG: FprA family A-type flavoprotein [Clostridia bacterium]|nr:FprA family A-type flavoprotein [Clostridia bacterium]MBR2288344.1 FprA family A-type flavoprotein [Clostridia bacterium]
MLSSDIRYIGVDDIDIDLFEGQYMVPAGMSYNSYVILDEKVAVTDTVDLRKVDGFLANLAAALDGRKPDYLIVHHVEPDHASSLQRFLDVYPDVTVVGNVKTFQLLENYFALGSTARLVVKEGDTLPLGKHTLQFVTAPMVHWPEVMMSYESTEKVLFSADAFGKFGARAAEEPWDDEARRYYLNIVGKYGPQVQAVLKKAAGLDIQTICPLHGPELDETIPHVLDLYQKWSTYTPEIEDGVFIAYASLHGNTALAAERLAEIIDGKISGDVLLADLARDDSAEALSCAFQYKRVVLAASTYNAGLMPFMDDFLHHLKAKNWQNHVVGLIENGSWAPMAAKTMKAELEGVKNITVVEPVVSIRGAVKEADLASLNALADAILA